ncbi:cell division protein DivIVA [Sporanaerobium hydrogeniformans]|uniref:Cell division protein DivIVA n=1 Tax=Sporanaerobium hydrogeniformans TaxID=3072179 RepID=A0AC61DEL3_9FIRM|nr:DivIVA domain-containing protein [Sporanaerobium hydrogeniformans]PHV71136.1 cell division protein DivIVA [Sporanaerobium hydrogeniformans]
MLSPVDIQNKVFRKAKLGGYQVEDVNEFFDEVLKSYQELTNENYTLKDKVNVLNESIQYYRTMEETIQNVLVLADKTAQDTKSTAYEKAEQVKKEAEQRAEKIIFSAEERANKILDQVRKEAFNLAKKNEELKAQYLTYRSQLKQMLLAQLDMLEQSEEALSQKEQEKPEEVTCEEKLAIEVPEFESLPQNTEERYYTKEYMPVGEEEH